MTVRILFPISPCWLEIFLRILRRAIKTLLLGLDFFYQLVAGGVVELVLLSSKLLLQAVDFVGLGLEVVLLGLKFLGELGEIALSLVGEEDRLFDVDGANFGARSL